MKREDGVAGLILDDAKQWGWQFSKMGWREWDQFTPTEQERVYSLGFPKGKVQGRLNPWLLDCIVDGTTYHPKWVSINKQVCRGRAVLSGCRTQFAVVVEDKDPKRQISKSWYWKDLKTYRAPEGKVSLTFLVDTIEMEINVPSGSLIDAAVFTWGSDPGARYAASRNMETTTERREEFMAVIRRFLRAAYSIEDPSE